MTFPACGERNDMQLAATTSLAAGAAKHPPAPLASALVGHASPVRDARLPCDSGLKQVCVANLRFLALAPVHPRCSRRLSVCWTRFGTLAVGSITPPTPVTNSRASPVLVCDYPLCRYLPCSRPQRLFQYSSNCPAYNPVPSTMISSPARRSFRPVSVGRTT